MNSNIFKEMPQKINFLNNNFEVRDDQILKFLVTVPVKNVCENKIRLFTLKFRFVSGISYRDTIDTRQ